MFMFDPPFQFPPYCRGVTLDRRQTNIQVTRLKTSHRRLRRAHALGHLGLRQANSVTEGRELPAQGMAALGHLAEAGKNGKVSLLVHAVPLSHI
jgi:hypothetical protein